MKATFTLSTGSSSQSELAQGHCILVHCCYGCDTNFRGYLSKMADEVNDMLQSAGHVVVSELSRQFNLPMDFLVEVSR